MSLSAYLASLDLKWMKLEKDELDQSNSLAEKILKEIHQDWRLSFNLEVAIKGPLDGDYFGNPSVVIPSERERYYRVYKQIPFALELGYRGFIYPSIDFQEKVLYQQDSKTSVIPHLFWLAMHLPKDGANIHVALVFDLITATMSANHINYYRIDRDILSFWPKVTMQELSLIHI